MVEYIVEYDYDAVHEDELSLRVGDVIRNVKKLEEEGWLVGEIHGKRGAFPDNFVKEIKKDPEPKDDHTVAKREKPGNVASLVQRMSVYGIPGMGPPPQAKPFKKKSKKRQCKVLFDYIPQNEDELELKVGEILEITEEVEDGWWHGTNGGQFGLFPSNFVKEVDPVDDGESVDHPEEPDPAAVCASPASPLLPSGNGLEASLSPIAQPKRVMGVGFGDIFKEGSVKLKPRIPNADPDAKKLEKPPPPIAPSGPKLSHTPSSEFIKTETDGKPKAKDTCRAMFAYDGVNDDELSFKEGDIIHLLSRDTGDPGWWKGELNGKEGVFPDNFAVILSESEREKPKKPPPPSKSPGTPKPELRIGEKRFPPAKPEEKDEKPSLDFKPSKPAAPQVPPKKPILANKSNSSKPVTVPPKRPEKPALPTPASKPNGDLPVNRPKSEFEPFNKTKMDLEQVLNRTKSVEPEQCAVKSPRESDLIHFDDLLPTSENLTHPTANRPKMAGKRPPGRFNGVNSHGKDTTDSPKVTKEEEDESAKVKMSEVKKPLVTVSTSFTSSPSVTTPTSSLARLSHPLAPIFPSPVPVTPISADVKTKGDVCDGKKSDVDELKAQMSELLTIVDTLRKEHSNELEKIKKDLEEEKRLRASLESEIDKLKKAVQLT